MYAHKGEEPPPREREAVHSGRKRQKPCCHLPVKKPKQLQAMLDIRNHAATLGAQVQRHTITQCSENFCCRRAQKPHLELQAIESFCCRRAQKPESKASCRSLLDLAHGCSYAPVHPLGWHDRLALALALAACFGFFSVSDAELPSPSGSSLTCFFFHDDLSAGICFSAISFIHVKFSASISIQTLLVERPSVRMLSWKPSISTSIMFGRRCTCLAKALTFSFFAFFFLGSFADSHSSSRRASSSRWSQAFCRASSRSSNNLMLRLP